MPHPLGIVLVEFLRHDHERGNDILKADATGIFHHVIGEFFHIPHDLKVCERALLFAFQHDIERIDERQVLIDAHAVLIVAGRGVEEI